MMAPHYERRVLLGEALYQATDILMEPIDSIVVHDDTIEVRAGTLRVVGKYGHSDSLDEHGSPKPGGGHWWVEFGEPEPVSAAWHERD